MRIDVVTIFPEFFGDPLRTGLLGKAIEAAQATVGFVDPRAFTTDRHKKVDDVPYGGGPGMVMKPDPTLSAIRAARANGGGPVLLLTPQGRPLRQEDLARWARLPHLVLVAGRYEGFDERIREAADEEVSLGDFVLTGGEYAALALIDGVIRLRPFTLGNRVSADQDSFSVELLEYPQYTRPPEIEGKRVPDVLLSGHHAEIAAWRHARMLERTRWRRPDLLARRGFAKEEQAVLRAAPSRVPPIELAVWVARADARWVDELVRVARAYGVRSIALVAAEREVEEPLRRATEAHAEGFLRLVSSEDEVAGLLVPRTGDVIVAFPISSVPSGGVPSGGVPSGGVPGVPSGGVPSGGVPSGGPSALVEEAKKTGATIRLVLGSRRALKDPRFDVLGRAVFLPTLRVASADNDLPLLPALAVLLDRLIGEG